MRTVAWQQALIIVLFTGLAIGNKRSLELTQGAPVVLYTRYQAFLLTSVRLCDAAHSSMPVTFARRQGWFRERQVDEWHERSFSLEERWKRWRDREEIKRLGFAALVSVDIEISCMSTRIADLMIFRCLIRWERHCGTTNLLRCILTPPRRVCRAMTPFGYVRPANELSLCII